MWLYNGTPFTQDMVGDAYSFVYCITNTLNGKMYIGKKVFWSKRTLPPLKGQKRRRKVVKPSDWERYWSSSKEVLEDVKTLGKEAFVREIISIHPDKREANYAELCEQITRNVLDARDANGERLYYNGNIDRIYYPSKNYGELRIKQQRNRMKRELGLPVS